MSGIRRIYVEKKEGFDVAARHLFSDLSSYLGIKNLENVRLLVRYDMEGVTEEQYQSALHTVFSEPPVDNVFEETLEIKDGETMFAVEYLPGQYDQRADSAEQCIRIMYPEAAEQAIIKNAQVVVLKGDLSKEDISKIKKYIINPVDSREAAVEKPETLHEEITVPEDVEVLKGFIEKTDDELEAVRNEMGLAMSREDILFCRSYFRDEEKRDPTITEIRLLDTYWSDHCRHTTFLTNIRKVEFEDSSENNPVKTAYENYQAVRKEVYGDNPKPECLMDIAVIGMKLLRKRGLLDNLEVTDEINACSIVVPAMIDGKEEEWLVMFKNETHNHPTEVEPFGGAATCLGGAIRDPLSGRSYVYQAMRVTGCGDPRKTIDETIPGKLPQYKITTESAHGYSSYGNQIGLATGIVSEIYHEGYLAKRMEVGAVIAAAPRANVVRGKPASGDVVVLVGGRTGRDGCGGATGSSKSHTEESILTCGAEVQKGNPPTERKIQRLFRNPVVSRMIKVCNDFGAGGVSVAIGELADGLMIDLDSVPKKYEGLDGTELAISESQERMAILIEKNDAPKFLELAAAENLEAVQVAEVTDQNRVTMIWRGKKIVDISRDFINTNGVMQNTEVRVKKIKENDSYFTSGEGCEDIRDAWLACLRDLNVCSQKGLVEMFDSTIGAGSVLLPFGGRHQDTPAECMAAKLPVLSGDTSTGTLMSYGFDPSLSSWSPFHGAVYAVVHSVAKIVAAGGDYQKTRLTLQEYFEKIGKDGEKWGKPFSALLGAFTAQEKLGIPAIGGKDSMSGTFEDISVPPTLISFAVSPADVSLVVSPEFKKAGSEVIYMPIRRDRHDLPVFDYLKKLYSALHSAIVRKKILSAHTVGMGGIAAAVTKMSFGNRVGIRMPDIPDDLFVPAYGAMVCEVESGIDPDVLFKDLDYIQIGHTVPQQEILIAGLEIPLQEAFQAWTSPLEKVFPSYAKEVTGIVHNVSCNKRSSVKPALKKPRPAIFIPVFPGTNCEYDTSRAFERAGGDPQPVVFKNNTANDITESIREAVKIIRSSQIIMIPGGFSAGDEPEGSGKFITAVFRNPEIKEAVTDLLQNRDGLMLGICNGFQALIKLGLVPYGEIRDMSEDCPTLTFNSIGRHISRMVTTRVSSTISPWLANCEEGEIHSIAISHGEGRFVANDSVLDKLIRNGQVATQYAEIGGSSAASIISNPNGSVCAVEGITSPDGRVFGKMGHSERIGTNVAKNIHGEKDQRLFEAGVGYFQ